MATVRKVSSGKWNVQIRRKGHTPISKSFIKKEDASAWIRSIESDMDKGIHINRSAADNTTFYGMAINLKSLSRNMTASVIAVR